MKERVRKSNLNLRWHDKILSGLGYSSFCTSTNIKITHGKEIIVFGDRVTITEKCLDCRLTIYKKFDSISGITQVGGTIPNNGSVRKC